MMRHDPDNLRPLEGTGPWLHEPRKQRRNWRPRDIAIGAIIGAAFPLIAWAAASLIQTIGSLL